MQHANRDGSPKILEACTLPLTGKRCTDMIVTDMAVIAVRDGGLVLLEHDPEVSPDDVQNATGAPLDMSAAQPMEVV